MQAGTLLVKLEEDAPFNGEVPEAGSITLTKTFRARSESTIDMYVRARIIPIIEKYDEEESGYVVVPIDINDVILNMEETDSWVYSNGYYYYNKELLPNEISTDVTVTLGGFLDRNEYKDVDVRVTLRVELESAQVHNDLWKEVFNISELPF